VNVFGAGLLASSNLKQLNFCFQVGQQKIIWLQISTSLNLSLSKVLVQVLTSINLAWMSCAHPRLEVENPIKSITSKAFHLGFKKTSLKNLGVGWSCLGKIHPDYSSSICCLAQEPIFRPHLAVEPFLSLFQNVFPFLSLNLTLFLDLSLLGLFLTTSLLLFLPVFLLSLTNGCARAICWMDLTFFRNHYMFNQTL